MMNKMVNKVSAWILQRLARLLLPYLLPMLQMSMQASLMDIKNEMRTLHYEQTNLLKSIEEIRKLFNTDGHLAASFNVSSESFVVIAASVQGKDYVRVIPIRAESFLVFREIVRIMEENYGTRAIRQTGQNYYDYLK
jgi:hypothetical protein